MNERTKPLSKSELFQALRSLAEVWGEAKDCGDNDPQYAVWYSEAIASL